MFLNMSKPGKPGACSSACIIVFISFIEKKGRRPFFDLTPKQELFRKRRGLRVIIYPSSKKAVLVCKNAICNML